MNTFIGTKILTALPMTLGEYNFYRGWDIPADENPDDAGYLVEYQDGGKANDARHQGYISWSPANAFEGAYQDVYEGMSFGHAIEFMKAGAKVARKGWNGKGMFILLVHGTENCELREGTPYHAALNNKHNGQGSVEILPHIDMYTVNAEGRRAMLPGWLASQTDMLSNDWVLIA